MLPIEPIASFDDLRRRAAQLPGCCEDAARAARARQDRLTKPLGALGRLEDLAVWLAAWQGREPPRLERADVLVFAGNHGVAARGVSAYPATVTVQMVQNFEAGGAAINHLCRQAQARLRVIALDLAAPTQDFCEGPAMSEAECLAAINRGVAAVPPDADLLALGEMGIGNTTAAAAICAALFGGPADSWAGPGTGLDAQGIRNKCAVIEEGLARHDSALFDPLEVLRRLGGREFAALAGALLAARIQGLPVLLDGYVTTAAAAVLHALAPESISHVQAAHRSAEPGHRRLLDRLGLKPLLELEMRLGEGSGAALAILLCRAALACHTGMATFSEAGVSGRG